MRREENQERGVWKPVRCMLPEGDSDQMCHRLRRPSEARLEADH